MGRQVAVTGMGMVTPLGNSVLENWDALLKGKSGLDFIKSFDTSLFDAKVWGQVKGLDLEACFGDSKLRKNSNPSVPFAMAAAKEAANASGFANYNYEPSRIGISLASGEVGDGWVQMFDISRRYLWDECIDANGVVNYRKFGAAILRILDPMALIKLLPNNALCQLSIIHNAMGQTNSIAMSAVSGVQTIGEAFHAIRRGNVEVMIAGGYESMINPDILSDYMNLGVLSRESRDPAKAIRPFDMNHDGFAIGEGAGIVVLEEMEHAKTRGARILAEVVGYGSSADAYDLKQIPQDGRGMALCMEMALRWARIDRDDISYINADGKALEENDRAETAAYKRVFSTSARNIPISSFKPATGYLGLVSGVVEFILTIMAMRKSIIPPTLNLTIPDPQCDLDYVPMSPREADIRYAITVNKGFGGQNASLIVKKVDTEC